MRHALQARPLICALLLLPALQGCTVIAVGKGVTHVATAPFRGDEDEDEDGKR